MSTNNAIREKVVIIFACCPPGSGKTTMIESVRKSIHARTTVLSSETLHKKNRNAKLAKQVGDNTIDVILLDMNVPSIYGLKAIENIVGESAKIGIVRGMYRLEQDVPYFKSRVNKRKEGTHSLTGMKVYDQVIDDIFYNAGLTLYPHLGHRAICTIDLGVREDGRSVVPYSQRINSILNSISHNFGHSTKPVLESELCSFLPEDIPVGAPSPIYHTTIVPYWIGCSLPQCERKKISLAFASLTIPKKIQYDSLSLTIGFGEKDCKVHEHLCGSEGQMIVDGIYGCLGMIFLKAHVLLDDNVKYAESYGHISCCVPSSQKVSTNLAMTLLNQHPEFVTKLADYSSVFPVTVEIKTRVVRGVNPDKLNFLEQKVEEAKLKRDEAEKHMDQAIPPTTKNIDRETVSADNDDTPNSTKEIRRRRKARSKNDNDWIRRNKKLHTAVLNHKRVIKKLGNELEMRGGEVPEIERDRRLPVNFQTVLEFLNAANVHIPDSLRDDDSEDCSLKNVVWTQALLTAFRFQRADMRGYSAKVFAYLTNSSHVKMVVNEGNGALKRIIEDSVSVKVNTRGASDDQIYAQNPHLISLIPRGMCFHKKQIVIHGLPKFGGVEDGMIDGTSHSAKLETTTLTSKTVTFIETRKANGENGQLSVYDDCGVAHICVGSKNVKLHLPFENWSSPDSSSTNSKTKARGGNHPNCKYFYANRILNHWKGLLRTMGSKKRELLKAFLLTTGFTLIFEFESPDHQHIVPILVERIVLIGLTSPNLLERVSHPLLTFVFGKVFELESVTEHFVPRPIEQLTGAMLAVALEYESEGSVFVLFDGDGETKQLKIKSIYYILLRVVREIATKVSRTSNLELSDAKSLLDKRITALKRCKDFVPLSDTALDLWNQNVLTPFLNYLLNLSYIYDADMIDFFPNHYRAFKNRHSSVNDKDPELYALCKCNNENILFSKSSKKREF